MHRPTFLLALVAASAVAAGACSGGDATSPQPSGALLQIVSGDGQRDTVAQTLPQPIVARVTDAQGHARGGVRVEFAVVDDRCGAAVAGSAVTGGDGRAQDRWAMGPRAGLCRMAVRALNGDGSVFAADTASVTITPGPMDTVRFLRSSPTFRSDGGVHAIVLPVNATFALTAIHLRAADRYGNEIAQPQVYWGYDGPSYVVTPYMTSPVEGFTLVYPSVPHRDTLFVLSLQDLTPARWNAAWTCRGGKLQSQGQWLPVDSMSFTFFADSARYTGEMDVQHVRDAAPVATAALRFRGTLGFTIWWGDGQVQHDDAALPHPLDAFTPATAHGPWADQARVGWQFPNALQTYSSEATPANNQPRWMSTRTLQYQYIGGGSGWCLDGMQNTPSTFRMSPV